MDDYLKLFEMSYEDAVNELRRRHGSVPHPYFSNATCKFKDKRNSRSKEGLEIHHVGEDRIAALSQQGSPWEEQQPDRLVYADWLEHLILHARIWIDAAEGKISGENGVGRGLFVFEIPKLNIALLPFDECPEREEWLKNSAPLYVRAGVERVRVFAESYIEILRRIWETSLRTGKTLKKSDFTRGVYSDFFSDMYCDGHGNVRWVQRRVRKWPKALNAN